MKVREYLAMGKKVVSNSFGDLGEFSPYCYQSASEVRAYARTIVQALEKGDGRERGGVDYIRREYDWAEIGGRFHARLAALLRKGGQQTTRGIISS
jgi:hypothetical protein